MTRYMPAESSGELSRQAPSSPSAHQLATFPLRCNRLKTADIARFCRRNNRYDPSTAMALANTADCIPEQIAGYLDIARMAADNADAPFMAANIRR